MNTKQKSVISSSPADRPVGGVLFCPQCGKYVKQHARHKRRFCSDRCRMKYWNSHPDLIRRMAYYTITCQNCGEEFRCYGNAHRKFCSRACYDAYQKRGQHHDE